jgi:hypothetical protein
VDYVGHQDSNWGQLISPVLIDCHALNGFEVTWAQFSLTIMKFLNTLHYDQTTNIPYTFLTPPSQGQYPKQGERERR